jgi:hypothetical protein
MRFLVFYPLNDVDSTLYRNDAPARGAFLPARWAMRNTEVSEFQRNFSE